MALVIGGSSWFRMSISCESTFRNPQFLENYCWSASFDLPVSANTSLGTVGHFSSLQRNSHGRFNNFYGKIIIIELYISWSVSNVGNFPCFCSSIWRHNTGQVSQMWVVWKSYLCCCKSRGRHVMTVQVPLLWAILEISTVFAAAYEDITQDKFPNCEWCEKVTSVAAKAGEDMSWLSKCHFRDSRYR